ncbi:MAG: hypothetical protein E6L02_05035 [Thaumarchaeota archaeon]|nr:MAG: hypothetical protein E6L02_05035 [Nitrososphaerota archaeon]
MSIIARLAQFRLYFNRGWSTIGMPFTFLSLASILYTNEFSKFFPSLHFTEFLIYLGIPLVLAGLIEGYWEYRKSVILSAEQSLAMQKNVEFQQLFEDIRKIKVKLGIKDE